MHHVAAQRPGFEIPVPVPARGGAEIVHVPRARRAARRLGRRHAAVGGARHRRRDVAGARAARRGERPRLHGLRAPGARPAVPVGQPLRGRRRRRARRASPARRTARSSSARWRRSPRCSPAGTACRSSRSTATSRTTTPSAAPRMPARSSRSGCSTSATRCARGACATPRTRPSPRSRTSSRTRSARASRCSRATTARPPLAEAEADAFWPLVLARAAVCAIFATQQARLSPDNALVGGAVVHDWAILRAVNARATRRSASAASRAVCGFAPQPGGGAARGRAARGGAAPRSWRTPLEPIDLVRRLGAPGVRRVAGRRRDGGRRGRRTGTRGARALGRAAPVGRGAGIRAARDAAPRRRRARRARHGGARAARRHRRARPASSRSRARSATTSCTSAWPASTRRWRPGTRWRAARRSASSRAPRTTACRRTSTCRPPRAPGLPRAGAPRERAAWLALCPDPSPLVGADARAPDAPDAEAERARRSRSVAAAQRLYYERPPAFVRGWRHHLYDADGRAYVDAVNNVAVSATPTRAWRRPPRASSGGSTRTRASSTARCRSTPSA